LTAPAAETVAAVATDAAAGTLESKASSSKQAELTSCILVSPFVRVFCVLFCSIVVSLCRL
jgi:hypothetical protein